MVWVNWQILGEVPNLQKPMGILLLTSKLWFLSINFKDLWAKAFLMNFKNNVLLKSSSFLSIYAVKILPSSIQRMLGTNFSSWVAKRKSFLLCVCTSVFQCSPAPLATHIQGIFLPSNCDNKMITPPQFSIMVQKCLWHIAELKWKLLGSSSLL